jgi:modulator of FtsH protease
MWNMNGWENFFIAEVGASAALLGLLFVGISISLTRILAIAGLPNRAFLALIILLAILIVSSLLLVPDQSLTLIGIEILVVGLVVWIAATSLDVKILRSRAPQYRLPYMMNFTLTQLALLSYIIAGIIVLTRGAGGLYWLVPAILISFCKAILDAWVLLVEINR